MVAGATSMGMPLLRHSGHYKDIRSAHVCSDLRLAKTSNMGRHPRRNINRLGSINRPNADIRMHPDREKLERYNSRNMLGCQKCIDRKFSAKPCDRHCDSFTPCLVRVAVAG